MLLTIDTFVGVSKFLLKILALKKIAVLVISSVNGKLVPVGVGTDRVAKIWIFEINQFFYLGLKTIQRRKS